MEGYKMESQNTGAATYEKGKLYDLPIIDLKIDPNQPRKFMDPLALAELAESIKRIGIIQPLLFRVSDESAYLLIVAGERRYKAAQTAGLLIVPGICVEGNAAEIALVENLQRQDLTCVEEAEALERLKVEQLYTDEQLSGVIGKARQTVSETMLLNRLPLEIRDECRGNRKMTRTALIEIARKKQTRSMVTAFNIYKEQLNKEGEGRKKIEKLSEGAKFCQALDTTRERVAKTDVANWSDNDLLAANDSVTALQEALNIFINPPTEGEENPPSRELS